jgi:hypothetical protein
MHSVSHDIFSPALKLKVMMSIYRSAEALRRNQNSWRSTLHFLSMKIRSGNRGMRRGAAEFETEDSSVKKNWISWFQAIGDAADVESSDLALRISPPDLSYSAAAFMVTAITAAQRKLLVCYSRQFVAVTDLSHAAGMGRRGADRQPDRDEVAHERE